MQANNADDVDASRHAQTLPAAAIPRSFSIGHI